MWSISISTIYCNKSLSSITINHEWYRWHYYSNHFKFRPWIARLHLKLSAERWTTHPPPLSFWSHLMALTHAIKRKRLQNQRYWAWTGTNKSEVTVNCLGSDSVNFFMDFPTQTSRVVLALRWPAQPQPCQTLERVPRKLHVAPAHLFFGWAIEIFELADCALSYSTGGLNLPVVDVIWGCVWVANIQSLPATTPTQTFDPRV